MAVRRLSCLICRQRRPLRPLPICRICFEEHIDTPYESPPEDSLFVEERRVRIERLRRRAAQRRPLFDNGDRCTDAEED